MVARGPSGERTISATDYFTGLWEKALNEVKLATELWIPVESMNENTCYVKFPQPASRYSYLGCGVALSASSRIGSDILVGFQWSWRMSILRY